MGGVIRVACRGGRRGQRQLGEEVAILSSGMAEERRSSRHCARLLSLSVDGVNPAGDVVYRLKSGA